MEKIRSFVAITLPADVQDHLRKIEALLKSGTAVPAKWVEPENIHLTLKFLGDTDPGKIGDIFETISHAAAGISPFALEIKGLGVFPGPRNTRIAWAGLAGDLGKLNLLQKNIEAGLEGLGFPSEKRGFSPHVTLARVRDTATAEERERFGRLVTGTFVKPVPFFIDSIWLIKSELTRHGPTYTPINSVLLK